MEGGVGDPLDLQQGSECVQSREGCGLGLQLV